MTADSDDRAIRVFVSSTFLDMQTERDVLVGRVFPQLRDLCTRRGVAFTEIDLRWGITDQEVAEGKVLPICLEEIRRCKPYFIGLLGERYGWVPHQLPEALLAEHGWLAPHEGATSVTELEILYGVLDDPSDAINAFFYVRDPAYVESDRFLADTATRPETRGFFREEATPVEMAELGPTRAGAAAAARRRHQADLVERVRASRHPVRDFTDADELADQVVADLESVIDSQYPDGSELDPLSAESLLHRFFAEERSRTYVKRASYLSALDEFAASDDGNGVLTVVGRAGSGKSALLATWGSTYGSDPPDALVLTHFIGSSPNASDLTAMLRRLNHALGVHLGIDDRDTPPPAFDAAFDTEFDAASDGDPDPAATFRARLYAAGQRGKVVLILDAVNQLVDDSGGGPLAWLAEEVPPGVRLVISTLLGDAHDELRRRGWLDNTLEVHPLELPERIDLIGLFLGRGRGKNLSEAQEHRIAGLGAAASPLFLRLLLDELRLWGRHETLDERIEELTRARDVPELLDTILERYEDSFQSDRPGLVGDALSLIWASRQGLQERELLELLGPAGSPMPTAYWSPLRMAASELLVDRGGVFGFAHDFIRNAVGDRYLPDTRSRLDLRRRVTDYFVARGPEPRSLDEAPYQLAAAQRWEDLAALLAYSVWFVPLWETNPSEVSRMWTRIEAGSGVRAAATYRQPAEQDSGDSAARAAYLYAASSLLIQIGEPTEALLFLEALHAWAVEAGDSSWIRASLGSQALIQHARGNLDRSLELHLESESISRHLDDARSVAISTLNQALLYHVRGQVDRALELLAKSAGTFRDVDDLLGLQASLGGQAIILNERGHPGRALELHLEAESICRRIAHPQGLSTQLGNQGLIHHNWGDLDRALALFLEAEGICRSLGDDHGLSIVLGNQGVIHHDRGQYERALELHHAKETICRRIDNLHGLQVALANQALIHRRWDNLTRAMELLVEQEAICRRTEYPNGLQAALGNQALILADRGEFSLALDLHREEEAICRRIDHPEGLAASLGNQAGIHMRREEYGRAMQLLQRQEDICRRIKDRRGLAYSLANQGYVLREQGDHQRAEAKIAEALRIARDAGQTALVEEIEELM